MLAGRDVIQDICFPKKIAIMQVVAMHIHTAREIINPKCLGIQWLIYISLLKSVCFRVNGGQN